MPIMAHLSPSPTATATTTCTLDSDKTRQADGPNVTYTTAGTIYDPKSVQPLQAPTRRARAMKFPFGTNTSGQPSLFPKSAIVALGLESYASARDSSRPQYSPLQQNLDRAVSPASRLNDDRGKDKAPLTPESPTNLAMELACVRPDNAIVSPPMVIPISVDNPVDNRTETNDHESDYSDVDEVDIGQEPLRNFPVKSLHNLASYPNPNQKRAQKVLRSARLTTNSAASNETNTRLNTPYNGAKVSGFVKEEQFQAAIALKSSYTDLPAMRRAHPGTINHDGASSLHASTDRHSEAEENKAPRDTYKTPLASVPGVPKPLTAGPPGQRSYKPSALDSNPNSLQHLESRETHKQVNLAEDEEAAIEFRALLQSNIDTKSDTVRSLSSKPLASRAPIQTLTPMQQQSPISTGFSKLSHAKCSVSEVLPPLGLHDLYGGGGQNERKKWAPGTYRRTAEDIQARNDFVSKQFYGQPDELKADTQDTTARGSEEGVGALGVRRGHLDMEHQKTIIHQANHAPTSEFMAPLLSMALDTLVRNIDAMEQGLYSHQYEKPDPRLVDTSAKGLLTFFGQSAEI